MIRHQTVFALLLLLAQPVVLSADEPSSRVRVVAHRGLLKHSPENTLATFRACLELRLGFELDVQPSKDGVLVCVHDDTVDRTTNGTGRVADLTLQELKKLDAGGWFDSQFAGERIPTLQEVFALLASKPDAPVLIAVDIKSPNRISGIVRLAVESGVLKRLLFIGRTISDPQVRKKIRAADRTAHVACVANNREEFASALADADSDYVYFRYIPTSAEINRVHQHGKQTFIAGATVAGLQTANWRAAVDAGLDAILTDYPLELAELLRASSRKSRTRAD